MMWPSDAQRQLLTEAHIADTLYPRSEEQRQEAEGLTSIGYFRRVRRPSPSNMPPKPVGYQITPSGWLALTERQPASTR
jgi:hypothetical protein